MMPKTSWFDKHLRKINLALFLIIVSINIYVIVLPFLPQLTYKVSNIVTDQPSVTTVEDRKEIDRSTDRLIIPKMHLEEKIWIGDNEKLVNKGVWHIPHSSTPEKGSNTVLAGHRFSYKDPAVFYHMDKMQSNDVIVAVWSGKIYTYKVTEVKIVKPTAVEIEKATIEDTLTLYTCNPLWSTRERLVVVAKLESKE